MPIQLLYWNVLEIIRLKIALKMNSNGGLQIKKKITCCLLPTKWTTKSKF